MFRLGIVRKFESQHFLIGGDWGAENSLHRHDYQLELTLEGKTLDNHGFLLDIVDVNKELDEVLDQYRGKTLNSLPDFEGINPSIERFARILCAELANRIRSENLESISVSLWESDIAWASYRLEF